MMGCGSLSNGYAVYTCDHCNNYLYVPFTCKSRFCCSCGTKYTLDRADTIARKSINCPHRHITFTIHHDLWPLFQKDRSLLNLLFDAVSSTMAAIIVLPDETMEQICIEISTVNNVVVPVNYNCLGRVVISGNMDVIKEACTKLKGAKAYFTSCC